MKRTASLLALIIYATVEFVSAAEWVFPPRKPLRVHVVHGIWSRLYHPDRGLARAGGALISESYTSYWNVATGFLIPFGKQDGGQIHGFPADRQKLSRHHVVIVINATAGSFRKGQERLVEYVKAGGSVFFLGGRYTFGKAYRDSPLAEVCPVEFPGEGVWGTDLDGEQTVRSLAPGPEVIGQGFANLAWDKKPTVYHVHQVEPKSESKVLLRAGDRPLLVCGTAGKGRVAVFAGTVSGPAAEGEVPFWTWDGWPTVFAETVGWLADARPGPGEDSAKQAGKSIAEARELLEPDDSLIEEDDEVAPSESKPDPRERFEQVLLGLSAECQDRQTARLLVKTAADVPGDVSRQLTQALTRDLWPLLDESFQGQGKRLTDSGQPNKTALGLLALGASRADGALETLVRFYRTGKPRETAKPEEEEPAGTDALHRIDLKPGAEQAAELATRDIRFAAMHGLGALGSAKGLDFLRNELKRLAVEGRYSTEPGKPDTYRDTFTDEHMLYQEALLAALRCGDETAAEPLVEAMLINVYITLRARIERNKPEDQVAKALAALPGELAFMTSLSHRLTVLPEKVFPAMARAFAAKTDRRVAQPAMAVFAGRPLTNELKAILRESPVATVSELGR